MASDIRSGEDSRSPAASLWLASTSTTGAGLMPYTDIRRVVTGCALPGIVTLVTLALLVSRTRVDDRTTEHPNA